MLIIECTICGKEIRKINKAVVEGTMVGVCDDCLKFGKRVVPLYYKPITRRIELKESEEDLVPDYGRLIVKERQNKGMRREEFAKRINEKESVIRRVEDEKIEPDRKLIKKIEKFFGIKLTQEYKEERRCKKEKKKVGLTVGDVVEIK